MSEFLCNNQERLDALTDFARSLVIGENGWNLKNCHPPASTHIVNELVNSFRKGINDNAEFWINMKGCFIHIRYFALRNEQSEYKGVIEVSQDVTGIMVLEGERRLLDW